FLYESAWNLIVFALLFILRKYNPLRGEIFLTYVISYSLGRFFIEDLRTDSLYMFANIRTAQFISILLIAAAVALIIYRRKSGMADKHYNGKKVKPKK